MTTNKDIYLLLAILRIENCIMLIDHHMHWGSAKIANMILQECGIDRIDKIDW